jgi:hypothetical protein
MRTSIYGDARLGLREGLDIGSMYLTQTGSSITHLRQNIDISTPKKGRAILAESIRWPRRSTLWVQCDPGDSRCRAVHSRVVVWRSWVLLRLRLGWFGILKRPPDVLFPVAFQLQNLGLWAGLSLLRGFLRLSCHSIIAAQPTCGVYSALIFEGASESATGLFAEDGAV